MCWRFVTSGFAPTNGVLLSTIHQRSGRAYLHKTIPQGQVKYVDLDLGAMTSKFLPNITIPLRPFQGTWAWRRRTAIFRL